MKRTTVALCLLGALLPPSAAHAATLDIDVRSNFFSPAMARPGAGDTVRWTVRTGAHDVVAYAGPMTFASEIMSPSSPPFTQTYTGGDVWYRCTPHSTVNANGICSGMCATLSDRLAAPDRPSVSQPADGAQLHSNAVTFAGSSEPSTVVRLSEGASTLADVRADQSGSWAVVVSMPGGPHTVSVRASGADGSSSTAAQVAFSIGAPPDERAPDLSVQSGPVAGGAGNAVLFGEASDNIGVVRVTIGVFSPVDGTRVRFVEADCPDCPATQVFWSAVVALPPGVWTAEVSAYDAAGNERTGDPILLVVIPG